VANSVRKCRGHLQPQTGSKSGFQSLSLAFPSCTPNLPKFSIASCLVWVWNLIWKVCVVILMPERTQQHMLPTARVFFSNFVCKSLTQYCPVPPNTSPSSWLQKPFCPPAATRGLYKNRTDHICQTLNVSIQKFKLEFPSNSFETGSG